MITAILYTQLLTKINQSVNNSSSKPATTVSDKVLLKKLDNTTRFIPDPVAIDLGHQDQSYAYTRLSNTSGTHDLNSKIGEVVLIALRLGEKSLSTNNLALIRPKAFYNGPNIRDIFSWLASLPAEDIDALTSPAGLSLDKLSQNQRAQLVSDGLGSLKDASDVLNGNGTLSTVPWISYTGSNSQGQGGSQSKGFMVAQGPPLNQQVGANLTVPLSSIQSQAQSQKYVYKPPKTDSNHESKPDQANSIPVLGTRTDKGYFTTLFDLDAKIKQKYGKVYALDMRLAQDKVYLRGNFSETQLEKAFVTLATAETPLDQAKDNSMTQKAMDEMKAKFFQNWGNNAVGQFLSSLIGQEGSSLDFNKAQLSGFHTSPFSPGGPPSSATYTGSGLGLQVSVGPSGGSLFFDFGGGKF